MNVNAGGTNEQNKIMLRLMGSPEWNGNPLGLGPKSTCILALMAMTPRARIDVADMDFELEGGWRCSKASRSIAHRIRLAGLPITTHLRSYSLDLDPGQIDVHVLGQLLPEGYNLIVADELDKARKVLKRATDITAPGKLLEYDSHGPKLKLWAKAVNDLRTTAIVYKQLLALREGQHTATVDELFAVWRLNPWREDLAIFLAITLHRCARGVEAQKVATFTRNLILKEELVAARLDNLLRRIAENDPNLLDPRKFLDPNQLLE